ncbi:MAG: zinc finger domain-containing protein [Thermoplasmatales archaeon]
MEYPEYCSSCGIGLEGRGATFFLCPNCGQETIARCDSCRELSIAYECPKCGFKGP